MRTRIALALCFLVGLVSTPLIAQQVVRVFGTTSGGTIVAALVDSSGRLLVDLAGGTITPTEINLPASTCADPALSETGALTTGLAFTSTPSILNCVSGTERTTLTASSLTSTVPHLNPNGSASAPSYSFASQTGTGFYYGGGNTIGVTSGGYSPGPAAVFGTAGLNLGASYGLQWSSTTAAIGTIDISLFREGAAHLFQRNGTTAERLSVGNTYTSATNYEAFSVDWQTTTNKARVGTRTAATGNGRELLLVAQNDNATDSYATIRLASGPALPVFRAGLFSAALGNVTVNAAGTFFSLGEFTSNATSGSVINTAILPTYNQSSGTAANTDLLVNRTQTAVGSGVQRLIQAQIGGANKFYVSADGTAKGTQEAFLQATPPTCTAANNCGTGDGTFATGSSDTAGTVTLGTTPASGFVITFNGTWVAAPVCQVWMAKAGMAVGKMPLTTVTTTTTITVVTNGTAPASADIYSYRCTGIQ